MDLLKLAWANHSLETQAYPVWKVKCLSLQAFSKFSNKLNAGCDLEVLDLAIHDEAEEVRNEAVVSMPVIVMCSGCSLLGDMFKQME